MKARVEKRRQSRRWRYVYTFWKRFNDLAGRCSFQARARERMALLGMSPTEASSRPAHWSFKRGAHDCFLTDIAVRMGPHYMRGRRFP
jgi:hypothetical protein